MSESARRIDYWQDPQAPKPTSPKTSASVFVRDQEGRLLLLQRVDNDLWTIPIDEVRQPINICLRARLIGGQIAPQPSEASEVRWVDPADLDDYPIHPALHTRIDHGLNSTDPYIT